MLKCVSSKLYSRSKEGSCLGTGPDLAKNLARIEPDWVRLGDENAVLLTITVVDLLSLK